MKNIFLIVVVVLVPLVVSAQGGWNKSNAQRRAAEKIFQMNDYVSYMADKDNSLTERRYFREAALTLFIGKGWEYTDNDTVREGVMMEISSVNRRATSHKLIRDYFTNLINLRYADVEITSTDLADIKISNLRRIDDNTYVCTGQFVQYFRGYNKDGRMTYGDATVKKVTCYITVEDTEDGYEYIVKLGDTYCISTERL